MVLARPLGVPLLAFAVLLDPLTNAIARWHDILPGWERRFAALAFHPGPLWSAKALLSFSAFAGVLGKAARTF